MLAMIDQMDDHLWRFIDDPVILRVVLTRQKLATHESLDPAPRATLPDAKTSTLANGQLSPR
jgi:hypothetical protein